MSLTFNFQLILYLYKSCQNSKESVHRLLTELPLIIIICHHAVVSRARKLTLSAGDLPHSIHFFHLCLFLCFSIQSHIPRCIWFMYSQSPLIYSSSSVIPFLSWLGHFWRGLVSYLSFNLNLAKILHFMNGVKPFSLQYIRKCSIRSWPLTLIYWSKWFLSDFSILKLLCFIYS